MPSRIMKNDNEDIKDVKTSKRIDRVLSSKKLKAEFGKGKLMPVFVNNDEEVGILILETQDTKPLGFYVTKEEAQKSVINATPLTHLSFPNNEDGRKSIGVLKEWLAMMESYMD